MYDRIHSAFSQKVYKELIDSGKTALATIGIPDWKPKVFQFTNERLQEKSRYYFSNDNTVWREMQGVCPMLPLLLNTFRADTLHSAEAICSNLQGCKWQNLPAAERKLLAEVQSHWQYQQLHVGKAYKNLEPVIASKSKYVLILSDESYLMMLKRIKSLLVLQLMMFSKEWMLIISEFQSSHCQI